MKIEEAFESREQSLDSATLVYFAFECETEQQAISGVFNTAPCMYDNLYYRDFRYEIINPTTHRVEMEYGPFAVSGKTQPKGGDSPPQVTASWRFSTHGGTDRVKQSLLDVGDFAPEGQDPVNHYGAIGVTKDHVEGVDVISPNRLYHETHFVPSSLVTVAYAQKLAEMTGSVNSAPFRAWDTGEVLFGGATMQSQEKGGVTIDFEFRVSPNAKNIQVGDIVIPAKYGWDYLWFTYNTCVDESTGRIIEKIGGAHIARVYPYYDFSLLGI